MACSSQRERARPVEESSNTMEKVRVRQAHGEFQGRTLMKATGRDEQTCARHEWGFEISRERYR
jgi:hypothetical protein